MPKSDEMVLALDADHVRTTLRALLPEMERWSQLLAEDILAGGPLGEAVRDAR